MRKYLSLLAISLLFFIFLIVFFVMAVNDLQCTIVSGNSCTSGVRLIGLKNDSGGFNNAHVQNASYTSYAYSLCCNNTNSSINITGICPGNATVMNISNLTNAHVEIPSADNYSIPICLSSDWKQVYCSFPTGSCGAGQACVLSMAGTEGDNTTNAHVANCSEYDQKICCNLNNSAPTKPTLYYPADANNSVNERKPNFNWSTSTDPDGDVVDYNLTIGCGACDDACKLNVDGISTTNYTVANALCVDTNYVWNVSACDIYDACNISSNFTFQIPSRAELTLIINSTSFGEMNNNDNDDTTDESPTPLVARNTGNVILNVTVNATALFDSVAMNTAYFRFQAEENESGSYVAGCSQTTWANMQTSAQGIFCNLSYVDNNDEADLELDITIPPGEGAGTKSSDLEVGITSKE
ncbi:MAG: hypothetical protein KKF46_05665 [Nanoarchaeota archaeon]|nr:hypothetical protein [Nanoarchaeota archaeon]MBU1321819.1 hypothetical protein [Nanoarchaeota archaeon]MBU1596987.1 hypothetical protein [Nanoarchaeota archaeon]MBU2442170.1 hypothetical protein [Nanoarchaeota archaeon]